MTGHVGDIPELLRLPVREAGRLMRAGRLTSARLTREALGRVDALDRHIHSFVLVTRERALAEAQAADRDFAAGIDRGPMQGIPYAVKDIFDVRGTRTTANSRAFAGRPAAMADSAVVERLSAAGAVLLGKLVTYECATVGPDASLPFPPARNPWNTGHVTGGSSSGAGAAVAAGFVRVAIGSDTAGSIRGPAGYCGVFGLKPSFGLMSRRGSLPMAPSLDHCGVIGATPDDIAPVMDAACGHDPADEGSVAASHLRFGEGPAPRIRGLRVGVPRHFFEGSADAAILGAIDRTLDALARAGADVSAADLPPYDAFLACGRIIMLGEAFAIHEAAYRKDARCFGPHMREWLLPGAFIPASGIDRARRLRVKLTARMEAALASFDVLLAASIMTPAPRFDALPARGVPPIDMQCFPANVTGHPAAAVPSGFDGNGLPLSLQLVGRLFDDARLLAIAGAVARLAAS